MLRLKIFGALILCLLVGLAVQAQAGSNGTWQIVTSGAVSIRIPADWVPDLTGAGALSADGIGVRVDGTLLAAGQTLVDVVNDPAGNLSDALEKQPVMLPAGEAYRLTGEHEVRYVLAVNGVLITLNGQVPADSGNPTANFALFDRIAHTLTIDDPNAGGWTRYTDLSGKISLRVPPDWQPKSTGAKVLTFIQPETGQVVTLNYRSLSQPLILEEAAQFLLDAYVEQNLSVAALDPVELPAGEAYRALLLDVPAQTAANTPMLTQQYQYIILRGSTLILVNAGCETARFEQCRPLLEQILDTLVFDDA